VSYPPQGVEADRQLSMSSAADLFRDLISTVSIGTLALQDGCPWPPQACRRVGNATADMGPPSKPTRALQEEWSRSTNLIRSGSVFAPILRIALPRRTLTVISLT
jgi:hypothetical protein